MTDRFDITTRDETSSPTTQPPDSPISPDRPRRKARRSSAGVEASGHSISIPQWRYQADAWRWVRRLNRRHANLLLRTRSARALPTSFRARFTAMGIPEDVVEETLGRIRRLDQWTDAWIETAQYYLGDFRRQTSAKNDVEGAKNQWLASLCYHAAQIFSAPGDERTVLMCRSASASLFGQAQPLVYPKLRRLRIVWRTQTLPAYLQVPETGEVRHGLVVMLNGASTSKEEMLSWSSALAQAGLAVLAMDSPGTGEATGTSGYAADHDDILDGVFDELRFNPSIDLARVTVIGVSMGGNQAIRCAAYDRRISGVIAVTSPYDPARWVSRVSPLLAQELASLTALSDGDDSEVATTFSLFDVAPRLRCPALIFGAGKDVVVPPTESQLLASRIGSVASLIWYPAGGHCLYDEIVSWTSDAALWIDAIETARLTVTPGGGNNLAEIAALSRDVLTQRPQLFADDQIETFDEGARLLDPAEIRAMSDDAFLEDDPDMYRSPTEGSGTRPNPHDR